MDYYHFTAEDFAADDYFKEWVCSPTADSDAFWRDFLRECPERYYQLEEARRLILGLSQLAPAPQVAQSVPLIWARIEDSLQGHSTPRKYIQWRWYTGVLSIAAVLAVLAGAGWLWWSRSSLPAHSEAVNVASVEWIEAVNEADKTMLLQLSDGSIVKLEKNSRLKYPAEFGESKREVHLEGGAFFEVQKNPKRPFLVFANGLVTRVLGTSFHVKAYQKDPNVTVAVRSGRVSVYADHRDTQQDPEAKGVVLTPNQQAVFHRMKATISKIVVESPVLLLPPAEIARFVFEEAPATEVFAALEKSYGIEVVFDEEVLKDCTLTINLTDENLFQKLEVICKVLDARYKLIDGQVIIYSRGC
ncbi:FecR family protein [Runella slithyformis]|uniref:Anti-FecI sigma factor, FecR n=1 Tax=Runella slithyformis (strain ATCC 29530 / DSM 19594 / LMG 11500 / NCIMB 11436 / LSU 4) TaxID=761193 RepID=A0A7U3ZHH5_RUNSL|nr:FecR family protein [Runella slithyformis]AEI47312.1 anti-FecI sigma factor, FecR [Runella slithyformis DSM 19594]